MKKLLVLVVVLVASLSVTAHATKSKDPLKGSKAAMQKEKDEADKQDLSRITEAQLPVFKKKKILVPLPSNSSVTVDLHLPREYRYCRPWTRKFLIDLGRNFEKKFGKPIQINSAVRTVEYQKALQKRNVNAAKGDRSSHLTGATVDIAKLPMSPAEIAWVQERLRINEGKGLVQATEEHKQAVFHVMVFRKYQKR